MDARLQPLRDALSFPQLATDPCARRLNSLRIENLFYSDWNLSTRLHAAFFGHPVMAEFMDEDDDADARDEGQNKSGRGMQKAFEHRRIPSSVERRKIKMASVRARVRRYNSLSVDA